MAKTNLRSDTNRNAALDVFSQGSTNRRLLAITRQGFYVTVSGTKIWIITEATDDNGKRTATTILLPEEYGTLNSGRLCITII